MDDAASFAADTAVWGCEWRPNNISNAAAARQQTCPFFTTILLCCHYTALPVAAIFSFFRLLYEVIHFRLFVVNAKGRKKWEDRRLDWRAIHTLLLEWKKYAENMQGQE